MSNMFSFKSLVTESNIERLFKRNFVVNEEVYMHSSLNYLREFNDSMTSSTEKMYKLVMEADSKTQENSIMCEYFSEAKTAITKFTNKINELGSRFKINIDNLMDTNRDLIDDTSILDNFKECLSYEMYKFYHMGDSNFPKLCPMNLYKKEFGEIGRLMQELSPVAKDEDKLKIIATVYNNLSKDMSNNWVDRVMDDILPDRNRELSFAENLYAAYKSETKEQVNLNKGSLYNAKEVLINYKTYIESNLSMIDNIVNSFNTIAAELGEMLFRNKDCRMKIKTDIDGVADRDYQLSVYSMNNLNIFMKAKINQIVQLCNLYTVAVSIKLDVTADFIKQNKELLEFVKNSNEENLIPSKEPASDDNMNKGDDSEDIEEPIDTDENEPDEENPEEPANDTSIDPEPEDQEKKLIKEEEPEEDETEEVPEESPETEDIPMEDIRKESSIDFDDYIFEYNMFNIEQLMNQSYIHETITSLLEEEQKAPTQNDNEPLPTASGNNGTNNPNGEPKKGNFIKEAIAKLVNLVKQLYRKFYDYFIVQSKHKINYVNNNKNAIEKAKASPNLNKILNSAKTYKIIDWETLNDLSTPALDNDILKKLTGSEKDVAKKFSSKYTDPVMNNDKLDIKATVMKYHLDGQNDQNTHPTVDMINKGVEFITSGYVEAVNKIRGEIDKLDKDSKNINTQQYSLESMIYGKDDTIKDYFVELSVDSDKTQDNNQQNNQNNNNSDTKNGNNNIEKLINRYYSLATRFQTAKMTVCTRVFNEYYALIKYILKNTGTEEVKEETPAANNQNQN